MHIPPSLGHGITTENGIQECACMIMNQKPSCNMQSQSILCMPLECV